MKRKYAPEPFFPAFRRFRKTDIFARKWVITIPRSGPFIIAGGLALGLTLHVQSVLATCIAAGMSLLSLIVIWESRWELRQFKYEIRASVTESRDKEPITFVPLNEANNHDPDFIRLSKP